MRPSPSLRRVSLTLILACLPACRGCDTPSKESGAPGDTGAHDSQPLDSADPTGDTANPDTGLGDVPVIIEEGDGADGPSVRVTSPTLSNRYTASADLLSLAGTASPDDVTVRWEMTDGSSGDAEGGTRWSAHVPLQDGLNTLRILAESGGEQAFTTLRVLYQPDVAFNDLPTLSAFIYRPDEAGSLQVGLLAEGAVSNVQGHLACQDGDEQVFSVEEAGEQEGFTLYQGSFTVPSEADDCDAWLALQVDGAERVSPSSALWVREAPSDTRLAELAALQGVLAQAAASHDRDWSAVWDELRPTLATWPGLDTVWFTGSAVFVLTREGLWMSLGGLDPIPESLVQGAKGGGAAPPPPPDAICGGEGADTVGRALYLYSTDQDFPYYKSPYPLDELQTWAADTRCVHSEDIHLAGHAAGQKDIADALPALGPGLVVLEGHGGNLPASWMPATWPPPTGLPYWFPSGASTGPTQLQVRDLEVCLLQADGSLDDTCQELLELYQQRFGPLLVVDIQPNDATSVVVRVSGVGGLFHSEIPEGALDDAIVLLSACQSTANASLTSVFTHKGAATVLGYTDETILHFMAAFENAFFGHWLAGYGGDEGGGELGDAFDAAWDDLDWDTDLDWAAAQNDPVLQAAGADPSAVASEPDFIGSATPSLPCCRRYDAVLTGYDADVIIQGVSGYSGFGSSMAAAGDVDGDGTPDLLVGHSSAHGTGAAWLYSGSSLQGYSGTLATADATLAIIQGASGDDLGYQVAGVGDTNLDGWSDILIGAPGWGDGGAALLYRGPLTASASASATLYGASAGDSAGNAVAGALLPHQVQGSADVNGDGYEDLLLGAYKATPGDSELAQSGAAYLFLGPVSGSWSTDQADTTFEGQRYLGWAGFRVGMLGDVDGDGYSEVAVHNANYGAGMEPASIMVWQGPVSGTHSMDAADGEMAASSPASDLLPGCAGDLNGDGYRDAFVGDASDDQVYILFGSAAMSWPATLASGADAVLTEANNSMAGDAVAATGDLDCDGSDDLLVGAPYSSLGAGWGGAAFLVMGPLQSGVYDLAAADSVIAGSAFGEYMGAAVAGVGDMSGDGCGDIAFSAAYGSGGGSVYLFWE